MPSTAHRSTDADDDMLFASDDDDEVDESSDPFEILAAREEAAGVPLYFMILETH